MSCCCWDCDCDEKDDLKIVIDEGQGGHTLELIDTINEFLSQNKTHFELTKELEKLMQDAAPQSR